MQQFLNYIHKTLDPIYSENEVGVFARRILQNVCGMDRVQFILSKDKIFSDEINSQLDVIVQRLANQEPIQYILGEEEFYGNIFNVAPGVLIPRAETEELVDLIIHETSSGGKILDIGTGSGCIAISLALNIKNAEVEAWDFSQAALLIAQGNNEKLKANVCMKLQDVFDESANTGELLDVIVSNPPYVMDSEKSDMQHNVLDHEPHTALFVSDHDPLLFYRRISELGLKRLKPGGRIYFEINALLGPETADLVSSHGYTDVRLIKDLYGKDRIVTAVKQNI
ncbi:MAG: peptide chain release factor N(5)-glutamine methyltransferase [Bacteroidales bacterium]